MLIDVMLDDIHGNSDIAAMKALNFVMSSMMYCDAPDGTPCIEPPLAVF